MPTIHVCPLHLVPTEVARLQPSALVTLLSPLKGNVVETPAALKPDRHLQRFFHDIPAPDPGLQAPAVSDVEAVLDFVRRWDRARPILIHCWAGISRSTASAYITALALDPTLDEAALADQLRAASPTATPNPMLIDFADDLLGRGGRMRRAIRAIGQGELAAHGEPFELPVRL